MRPSGDAHDAPNETDDTHVQCRVSPDGFDPTPSQHRPDEVSDGTRREKYPDGSRANRETILQVGHGRTENRQRDTHHECHREIRVNGFQGMLTMVTVPEAPSTVITAPSGMRSVASVTLTTHGIPNSRLTMIA